jgi:glucose/arabinose dehydrogenase
MLACLAVAGLASAPALAQQGYTVPPGNPFAGRPGAAPEVWAYGFRNPYRFSFDRATGALLIGDVGGSEREEVDLLGPGVGGANFGWNCREGKAAGPGNCVAAGAVDPIFDYSKASPRAITGGYVVRDPALAGLVGRYLYADYYDGEIRSIRVDATNPDDRSTGAPTTPNLSSFGEDAAGRIYTTDLAAGVVYRLTPGASPGTLGHVQVGGSFNAPTYVTAPPEDTSRLFVTEREGRVRVVVNGATQAQPFLDISGDTSTDGERGLLSIAFAPDYSSSGKFYVFHTDSGGDLRIEEFRRSAANPNLADPATRRGVLTIEHSAQTNHNGGTLQFGPDGCLYAGTGDGGGQGDPNRNAQNLGALLGKLLRIDPGPSTPCRGVGAAGDRTAPRLRVRVPKRQRVRRRRGPGVLAYARCNENCTVSMSARVVIGRGSYTLKKISRRARANRRIKLRLRLTRRGSRAIKSALRPHSRRGRPRVRVALRARDGSGNRSRLARARVRVRR